MCIDGFPGRPNDKHGSNQACKRDPESHRVTVGPVKEKTAEPGADGAAEADAEGKVAEDRAEMLAMKNIG